MIAAAAVAIFVAAVLVLLVFRLAFGRRLRMPGGRARQMRLGIVDAFDLDRQRQLVIIRRDNIEHLVMIGGPNDILIESQIIRSEARSRDKDIRDKDIRDKEPVHVPAPSGKPPVVEPRLPTPAAMPEPLPAAATQEAIPAPVATRSPSLAPTAPILNRPLAGAAQPRRVPPVSPPQSRQPSPAAEVSPEGEAEGKPPHAPLPARPLGAPLAAQPPATPTGAPPFFRASLRQPQPPAPPQPAMAAPLGKPPLPPTPAPAGPPVPSLEGLESLEEEMAKLLGRGSTKP
jgi:hypothetical protein